VGLSLEGGILGAADTTWIATRSAAASMCSLIALGAFADDLFTIWISLKLFNNSTQGLDLFRFMSQTVGKVGSGTGAPVKTE
jgi:hypothetical protein